MGCMVSATAVECKLDEKDRVRFPCMEKYPSKINGYMTNATCGWKSEFPWTGGSLDLTKKDPLY